MTIENFFARQRALHRTAGDHGELGNYHFMIEGITLTAKAAAVRCGNDANVAGRNFEDFGERAMNVVRCLGCAPQRELVVGVVITNRCVLLHRQVCITFIEESIFANQISLSESFVGFTEFQRDFFMNVAAVAVFMNARLIYTDAFFNRRDCLQGFVIDLNQIHRVEGDVFINGGDRRYRIANEAHLVDAKSVFILTDGKNAVGNWQVLAGEHCQHTGQRQSFREIDAFDQGVWQVATENSAIEHARQKDVVGKLRLAGALGAGIDLAKGLADYIE